MSEEILKEARARVANMFGEKLASKASDSFCLTYGRTVPSFATFETVSEQVQPQSIIVEFTPQPAALAIIEAVEQVRKSKAWGTIRNVLKKIELPASAAVAESVGGAAPAQGEPTPATETIPVHAARLLRHVKVLSVRDNFLKASVNVRSEIERSARGFFHAGPEALASPQMPSSVTQVCWLNRTMRSFVNPRALAEVVGSPEVARIDLPRLLQPELDVTGRKVGAPQFRKKFKGGGKDIIVAVLDSEVTAKHPALKGRVVHKENYTLEPWGNPGSHGTAVAGIVASNDANFTGMAPEATIYNYKVLATNKFLNSDNFGGSLAIQQAVEDGAHIANCSWGAGAASDGTSPEAVACDTAWALGLVIVKSAGNAGPDPRTLTTPADAEGVIAVGATNREGTAVPDYSSRGPADTKHRPHLLAPGGSFETGITSCLVGGGFGDCGAGTSFAAPHVSGLLALMIERNPNLTPDDLRQELLAACTPLAGLNEDTQGVGFVTIQ
jgi:serine protease AprX